MQIRQLKSSQSCVRINCYTIDELGDKERIGIIMIGIRCAAAVPLSCEHLGDYTFHKLINVPGLYRAYRPELALNLSIRDMLYKDTSFTSKSVHPPSHQIIIDDIPVTNDFKIGFLENGWVQLGETNSDFQKYVLKFYFDKAYNMDLLLDEVQVFNKVNDNYYIMLKIFGMTVNTNYINKNLFMPLDLKETLSIKLITNFETLKTYIETFKTATLQFYHGSRILGSSEVVLSSPSEQFSCYIEETNCDFSLCTNNTIPFGTDDRKPYVTVEVSFEEYNSSSCPSNCNLNDSIINKIHSSKSAKLNIEKSKSKKRPDTPAVQNGKKIPINLNKNQTNNIIETEILPKEIPLSDLTLDQVVAWVERTSPRHNFGMESPQKIVSDTQSVLSYSTETIKTDEKLVQVEDIKCEMVTREDAAVQTTPREKQAAKSIFTLQSANQSKKSSPRPLPYIKNSEYSTFQLSVDFRSVTWRTVPKFESFNFKIHHPKANNVLVIHCNLKNICVRTRENIILTDMHFCIHYLSTFENIRNLITMHPPKISLHANDELNIAQDFVLYTKLLNDGSSQCNYFATPNSLWDKDEIVCDIQVDMVLQKVEENLCKNTILNKNKLELSPIVIDDLLTFDSLNEIQLWKNQQEITFQENLKRLQVEQMAVFQAEWDIKRNEYETKLKQGMEKCKLLSEQLSIAANELEQKRCLTNKSVPNKETQDNVDAIQKIKQDMEYKISILEKEKEYLELTLDQIKKENVNLQDIVHLKQDEIESIQKYTLTKEQTKLVFRELKCLEEKFQQALVEKAFFKDQWRKALKEVHILKSEDQRQIQMEIKKRKEELSQINLDLLYCSEDSTTSDENVEHSYYFPYGDDTIRTTH